MKKTLSTCMATVLIGCSSLLMASSLPPAPTTPPHRPAQPSISQLDGLRALQRRSKVNNRIPAVPQELFPSVVPVGPMPAPHHLQGAGTIKTNLSNLFDDAA